MRGQQKYGEIIASEILINVNYIMFIEPIKSTRRNGLQTADACIDLLNLVFFMKIF